MARGFNSTYGVNGSDKITTALTSHAVTRTYFAHVFRHGTGGSGLGRIFDKRTSGGQVETWYSSGTTDLIYERQWSGGNAIFKWSGVPTADTWMRYSLTYDSSSTANDPEVYENGSIKTLTTNPTPSGSVTNNAEAYVIGNRGNDNGRGWDGMIAEFAIWDRVLSADECAALTGSGFSPLHFARGLVLYEPMMRDNVDRIIAAPTISGTAVQDHPRVFYPGIVPGRRFTTAVAAGGATGKLVGGGLVQAAGLVGGKLVA